ncbi:MAG: penicillin-binding transpeptidase domain-containing protein [Lachnospiraceae bacterium]|nr:penicillin-binding transpeptidase domain-containing protein [Lachnospiraceae bacterium]
MNGPKMSVKKRLVFVLLMCQLAFVFLVGRVAYIQIFQGEELQSLAYEQQTRDRLISPKRGSILDRNDVGIAVTESVNAVSVIHAQIEDEEETAAFLSEALKLDYGETLEKIKKRVALMRIKTKVDKETANIIRQKNLPGVEVDEDVKRIYPYSSLASHVIGFVGKDNQGIIGIESKYDEYLKGEAGKIFTVTDAKGLQISDVTERSEPIAGGNLVTTLDIVIQQYAEQTLKKAVESKEAKSGIIIVMNPQNGEIYAMAVYPDFNLNEPFEINNDELKAVWDGLTEEEKTTYLNKMWRNTAINDTYEPGSTFKVVTSSAGLQEGVVTPQSTFFCRGFYIAGDRMIKCWRYPRTHGAETFVEGVQNSCNPVFMEVAERLGADRFHDYLIKFGFDKKTGVDLPGEAVGIMYKKDEIGPVELATMAFGQSLQITPLQLLRGAAAVVNGGYLITPHIAQKIVDDNGGLIKSFDFSEKEQILSKETSDTMRYILESVVSEGTGGKTYISGYRIGGKTATSEKLPRKNGKYIASFLAFAPADDPKVMALVIIDEPQGIYYGGTVAGPAMKELLSNTLPYLGVERILSEAEKAKEGELSIIVPDIMGLTLSEAKNMLYKQKINYEIKGTGEGIYSQFPKSGETINADSKIIIYTK